VPHTLTELPDEESKEIDHVASGSNVLNVRSSFNSQKNLNFVDLGMGEGEEDEDLPEEDRRLLEDVKLN